MNIILKIIEFLVFQILSVPAILLGVVAMTGLILLKRPVTKIITGTLKTIIGVLIISGGATVISGSLDPFGKMINHGLNVSGIVPTNEAVLPYALKYFGSVGALVMVGGFVVNILLAKFTKYKFIYLTGHIMLYLSLFVAVILESVAGMKGWALILTGSIIMGIYFTFMPALDCPVMFPYAPTALIIGFISMFVGMVIGMFIQLGMRATYIILPGIVPAFFSGGTAGIFGNSTGGWKGAVAGPFIMGIVLAIGTGWLIPSTGALAKTGSAFGDPTYATLGLAFAKIAKLFSNTVFVGIGIVVILVVLAAFFLHRREKIGMGVNQYVDDEEKEV